MPSKKRVYLQQFGIIHLPNPNLTYTRNPERETKLYLCPSTSWKLKSGTLLYYLFLFSPSHLTRNHDANRAPKIAKNCQIFCQTVGGVFLMFLPKIKDDNSICQTAGDALMIVRDLSSTLVFSSETYLKVCDRASFFYIYFSCAFGTIWLPYKT